VAKMKCEHCGSTINEITIESKTDIKKDTWELQHYSWETLSIEVISTFEGDRKEAVAKFESIIDSDNKKYTEYMNKRDSDRDLSEYPSWSYKIVMVDSIVNLKCVRNTETDNGN
jgi:hypothetical protein